MEYLHAQSGVTFSPKMEDFDEGFGEMEDEALYSVSSPDGAEDILTFPTVSDSESDGEEEGRSYTKTTTTLAQTYIHTTHTIPH